jgi:CubicO group peptidase (beta-lactamase class C family)
MRGSPPPPDRLVTLANWLEPPFNRWSFQRVRELVPSAAISRGDGPVWELPDDPVALDRVPVRAGDRRRSFGGLLEDTFTDGVIVLHRGRALFEGYWNGMTRRTPHLVMSVTKSITATAVGVLVARGSLSPEQLVTDVLPELAETSFEGCTIRHLLDMRAGTAEDPLGANGARAYLQVCLWQPRTDAGLPAGMRDFYRCLSNDGPHGGDFRYRSILTNVLAWAAERASGVRFPELLSRELWARLGAEQDAEITVDGHGSALADIGLSCTLRDLARFGELMRLEGRRDGVEVVPQAWIDDTLTPEADSEAAFRTTGLEYLPLPGSYYRNQWWVARARDRGPVYLALGIHGQMVLIHGPAEVVVAKVSTWPESWSSTYAGPSIEGCIDLAERIAEERAR